MIRRAQIKGKGYFDFFKSIRRVNNYRFFNHVVIDLITGRHSGLVLLCNRFHYPSNPIGCLNMNHAPLISRKIKVGLLTPIKDLRRLRAKASNYNLRTMFIF